MKRKHAERSLADEVLREKLRQLRRLDPSYVDQGAQTDSFSYLLDVCLALQRREGLSRRVSSTDKLRDSESTGEYDLTSLQNEPIEDSVRHVPYTGSVKVGSVVGSKIQGVIATSDILKGQLICTSVPTIVVHNLAEVNEPSDMVFSDLSRAEMTAELILLAEKTENKDMLDLFEWAGKEDHKDDLRKTCENVILKYTWAIDHSPSKAKSYNGSMTKVAGHAFALDGYASKFNHSCTPNATMVTYGAIQFFKANCHIHQGNEICVSYGFDPLDTVQERGRKLHDHGEFDCECSLCQWEIRNDPSYSHVAFARNCQNRSAKEVLSYVLQSDSLWQQLPAFKAVCISPVASQRGSIDATSQLLQQTAALVDDDEDLLIDLAHHKTDLVTVLWTLNHFTPFTEHKNPETEADVRAAITLHSILLSLMFLSLSVRRSDDTGIPHGDLFRTRMQSLAGLLDRTALYDPSWWRARSMEFTDVF